MGPIGLAFGFDNDFDLFQTNDYLMDSGWVWPLHAFAASGKINGKIGFAR